MKRIRYIFAFILIFHSVFSLFAQQVPIGQWRDELPYYLCNSVTDAGSRIYASTPFAVFYFNKEDNSVARITKISGLSDIGISAISYSKEYKTLVIAYSNANIDLIKENQIINISDIKRKQILGNKTINNIFFIGKDAYLSCGFGIVALDIVKEEIRETYYIGSDGSQVNVLAIAKDANDTLFAATEKGIYKAWAKDPNLANFASWHKDPRIDTSATYNTISWFAGKVFVSKRTNISIPDTIFSYANGSWSKLIRNDYSTVKQIRSTNDYLVVSFSYFVVIFNPAMEVYTTIWSYEPGGPFPLDAIADAEGKFWVADNYMGLINYDKQSGVFNQINLGGPLTSLAFSMTGMNNDLYIAPGGKDASFIPIYTQPQVYHFNNTDWKNLTAFNNPVLGQTHDIVTIAVNPTNSRQVFAGSYGKGLVEIYNDSAIRRYTESNSTLRHHTASDTSDIRVGGATFDKEGRLWVVTSHNNSCLSVKDGDKWTGFTIPKVNENDLGQIIVDKHGQKWIQMRYGNMNPNSILVFSDNNTLENTGDDQSKLLNSTVGSGNIPGNNVFAMAEDQKGEIWIGTEKGIAVFYSPENVFSDLNFDAQRILVTQGGYVQYLLENETVTAIAVDGANRKWVGTDRGGVFLFSEDGVKQIYHFTAENSPLLSDRITCIALNQDGEVFFGTDKGVISFRASATPGGDTFGDVYAFPNPVKPDYDGYIAIKGLVSNAQVRITDVNGTLVYSTRAEGGQAIWDGKNFDRNKVRTGVYLVTAANDTGSEKVVTKILFIN
ncbi:MAG: T9SS type A sorting domain-containing protein [Bacteroidetes bacterium]|nr:T9SS type A sorting domain-containing protein [Bacteroidota bacterium]